MENKEDVFCIDVFYDFMDNVFLGDYLIFVDVGYCYNELFSVFDCVNDCIGGFSCFEDSLNGILFFEFLVLGLFNYGDVDGCDLFIVNFLLIDLDCVFFDLEGVFSVFENVLV